MENTNYAQALSRRILTLRKEKGLTQEALAGQLGVSYQAVSKWENAQSCPDIALLPVLADIYAVSIDSLFGREVKEEPPATEEPVINPVFSHCDALPWPDDETVRGVVAWGHKILGHGCMRMPEKRFVLDVSRAEYTWLLRYGPLNVHAECVLVVEGDIKGSATVGSHMRCNDIAGDVTVGSHMSCGDIGGDVTAGSHIKCVSIQNDAMAGNFINCRSIGGDAKAKKIVISQKA